MSEDITLNTPTGSMTATCAAASSATAVIVIQEAFGLNGHIKKIAENFSKAGHFAIAPDLYHQHENSIIDYEDFGSAVEIMLTMEDSTVLDDVDACLDYLQNEKGFAPEAIGIVGFCMGGRIAFLTSLNRQIGAGVSFYGGGIVTDNITGTPPLTPQAKDLKTPWLGFFGDLDTMIPTDGVEELRQELQRAAPANQIVRYPQADHGFHCDERESFNAEASADAWDKTLAWFSSHLKA